jgi:4'-phosphopantetheinyl transferase
MVVAVPSEEINLATANVEVWTADLDTLALRIGDFVSLLAPEERNRAGALRSARHRCRFIAGRGILRLLLSSSVGIPPMDIELVYGPRGKPSLAPRGGQEPMHFNVSHSAGVAVFALSRDIEVGIDVEVVRPNPDALAIARRYFTADESALLEHLPPEERTSAFFHQWTRKEACIKAWGGSILLDLRDVDVSDFSVSEIRPTPKSIGAVAARGASLRVEGRTYEFKSACPPFNDPLPGLLLGPADAQRAGHTGPWETSTHLRPTPGGD